MQKFIYLTLFTLLLATGKISAQVVDSLDRPNLTEIEIFPADSIAIEEIAPADSIPTLSESEYDEIEIPRKFQMLFQGGGHWAGIGFGYNGLITNLSNLSVPNDAQYLTLRSRSMSVAINPLDFNIISSRNFLLFSGFGFEINNFFFSNNNTIKSEDGAIAPDFSNTENGMNVRKSKLVTSYFNIPLLMEFRMGYSGKAFINFGVIGGWRLVGRTKLVGFDGNNRNTIKNKQNLHLRDFHYGATLNVGYKHSGLSIKYYPHSIFKSGQGPDVQQINIGYMLML